MEREDEYRGNKMADRKDGRAGYRWLFMQARGGLQTEYMGKEWFNNVDVLVIHPQTTAWAMHNEKEEWSGKITDFSAEFVNDFLYFYAIISQVRVQLQP